MFDDSTTIIDDIVLRGETYVRAKVFRRTAAGWLFDGCEAIAMSYRGEADRAETLELLRQQVAIQFGVATISEFTDEVFS
jgi:hypothetical protein